MEYTEKEMHECNSSPILEYLQRERYLKVRFVSAKPAFGFSLVKAVSQKVPGPERKIFCFFECKPFRFIFLRQGIISPRFKNLHNAT